MITIWLDRYLTPSLNKSLRTHWAKRKRDQDVLSKLIYYTYQESNKPFIMLPIPIGRRKVTITSYRRSLLDHDNYTGGLKQLIDVLRKLGFIQDDSPAWLELEPIQLFSRDKKGTEIQITSL